MQRTPNKSPHTKLTQGKKFSRRSCRDSNSQPFDHESGALTNKLLRLLHRNSYGHFKSFCSPGSSLETMLFGASFVQFFFRQIYGISKCIACFWHRAKWWSWPCFCCAGAAGHVNVVFRLFYKRLVVRKKSNLYHVCVCVLSLIHI